MTMTYEETVDYLYNATPQFQQIGAAAYKPGLDTVRKLSALTGNSHLKFPAIHVAGTNGKGSTSHTLAAVLQSAGYRVGLYTSPHLLDFRERIKVNGSMIEKEEVCGWIENYLSLKPADMEPSFFELTTVMAFDIFASRNIDIAIIEVGLGGRLDSTNIITPILSVITNISKDHTAQLGNTMTSIAYEKAGIIKTGIPVILGESDIEEVVSVISSKARETGSQLIFGDRPLRYDSATVLNKGKGILYENTPFGNIRGELQGDYQLRNTSTVLASLEILNEKGWRITSETVAEGFANVSSMTGLAGRWTITDTNPLTVCDTGHNEGGWRILGEMLKNSRKELFMVVGFVNDKDVDSIMRLMPKNAKYYFTCASVPRAMKPSQVKEIASTHGLSGSCYEDVETAVRQAKSDASTLGDNAMVFIGGSTFVVADFLASNCR